MSHKYLKKEGDAIGCYVVEEILGYGAEGDVYKVRNSKSGKTLSLKLLRGRNMELEARAAANFYGHLARCRCKSVKRFRTLGVLRGEPVVGDRYYLCFEFIDGISLDCYLTMGRRLPCAALIKALCEALVDVHTAGYAVGDLSRGRNLLIEQGTNKLIFCDLDYGTPRWPNRDRHTDLIELRRMARQIYRDSFTAPEKEIMAILNRAKTVRSANSMLGTLIFNGKPKNAER